MFRKCLSAEPYFVDSHFLAELVSFTFFYEIYSQTMLVHQISFYDCTVWALLYSKIYRTVFNHSCIHYQKTKIFYMTLHYHFLLILYWFWALLGSLLALEIVDHISQQHLEWSWAPDLLAWTPKEQNWEKHDFDRPVCFQMTWLRLQVHLMIQ